MASTDTEIANMALSRVGAAPITALEDENDRARIIRDYYEPTVQLLLRKHTWNFAIKRVALSQNTEAPVNEWDYAYALPSDPYCVKVIQINDGRDDFVVEGRNIVTDEDSVILKYIARVNEGEFDPLFVRVLVLELALAISYRLTVSESTRGQILQELNTLALPEARFADAMEAREPLVDPALESTWISARYGRMT